MRFFFQATAILLLAALAGSIAFFTLTSPRPQPGTPLPVLNLSPLDGYPGFEASATGEPYLINIWGSWCAPCRFEHATLMALKAEGITIYGINWRDETRDAHAFLEELGDPYDGILADPDGQAVRLLEVTGAPETLIINHRGEIVGRWGGPITVDALRQEIYPSLEQAWQRTPSR